MNCLEWEREIAIESESAELGEHLAVCPSCREFAREIEANRAAIRTVAVDPSVYSAVRQRVLAEIQAERRRRSWWMWPAAAAAACVAILTVSMLSARFAWRVFMRRRRRASARQSSRSGVSTFSGGTIN